MKRAITVAAACLGIAVIGAPASQAGDGNGGMSATAKQCTQLAKADRAAFRALYGPKRAMRKCIRGDTPKAKRVGAKELKNAARTCRAERAEDPEAFQETYGTNDNKRNAFGKCVSGLVKDKDKEPEDPEDPEDPEAI